MEWHGCARTPHPPCARIAFRSTPSVQCTLYTLHCAHTNTAHSAPEASCTLRPARRVLRAPSVHRTPLPCALRALCTARSLPSPQQGPAGGVGGGQGVP